MSEKKWTNIGNHIGIRVFQTAWKVSIEKEYYMLKSFDDDIENPLFLRKAQLENIAAFVAKYEAQHG